MSWIEIYRVFWQISQFSSSHDCLWTCSLHMHIHTFMFIYISANSHVYMLNAWIKIYGCEFKMWIHTRTSKQSCYPLETLILSHLTHVAEFFSAGLILFHKNCTCDSLNILPHRRGSVLAHRRYPLNNCWIEKLFLSATLYLDKYFHVAVFKNHFIEVWLTYKRMHVFNVYNLISLKISKYSWNHHHNLL